MEAGEISSLDHTEIFCDFPSKSATKDSCSSDIYDTFSWMWEMADLFGEMLKALILEISLLPSLKCF